MSGAALPSVLEELELEDKFDILRFAKCLQSDT